MSYRAWQNAIVAVMVLSMAASVTVAQVEVSAGYDLFITDPVGTDLLGIQFKGSPSIRPTYDFLPPPPSADRRRAIGDTDTIVHRLESAVAPGFPGTADPIAIELVALGLVSINEFDVDGDGTKDGAVYVTLHKDRNPAGEERLDYDLPTPPGPSEMVFPGNRSFGIMTITFTSPIGGTFDSHLDVYADLRIGAPNGPIVCGENAGLPPCADFDAGLALDSIDSDWGRNALANSIMIRGVNYSLAAPERDTPVDTSIDFWAGVSPEGEYVCVDHGGHPTEGGPTRHRTCRVSCTTRPVMPDNCRNGRDDDCNGTIDDCDEDHFGPVVVAPDGLTFECPHPDVSPDVTGFATGTDNCFPPTLTAAHISYQDFLTPQCGQTFDLDRVWTAVDDCGNDASTPDLQQIFVVDTTPPNIECPPERVILWTADRSPAALGSATGSDTCGEVDIDREDLSIPGICLSEEVTRTWTATDECDHETPCDQPIHVRGPRDAIRDLQALLLSLELPKGIENSLSAKLRAAERSACGGRPKPAVNQLDAFVNQVTAQRGKKIPADAADDLIDAANSIIDAIGEEGVCPDGC
jgi:hypothetical protein